MAATRTYGPAGDSTWKLTVSTIARALPNDGDLVAAMLTEIGVAKISPLGFFTFANQSGEEKMRLDEYGIQLATKQVESAAIYGVEEFSSNPSAESSVWKLAGQIIQGLGVANVTLSANNSNIYIDQDYVSIQVNNDYLSVMLLDDGSGDGLGPHIWLPPISAFSLAMMQTTISSGAIGIISSFAAVDPSPTPAGGMVVVDTEGAAASDNLDSIYWSGTSTAELRDGQVSAGAKSPGVTTVPRSIDRQHRDHNRTRDARFVNGAVGLRVDGRDASRVGNGRWLIVSGGVPTQQGKQRRNHENPLHASHPSTFPREAA